MKSIVKFLVLCLIALSDCSSSSEESNEDYYSFNNPPQVTSERHQKMQQIIEAHNRKFEAGEVSFTMGMNKWFDAPRLEGISEELLDMQIADDSFNDTTVTTNMFPAGPSQINWQRRGHVTPVKDQGFLCNSCYAFSATAALEPSCRCELRDLTSIFKLKLSPNNSKYGKLRSASEQNQIDCNKGNWGCRGGAPSMAYYFVHKQGGIASMESYPYQEATSHKGIYPCRYNPSTSVGTTKGLARIPRFNETLLRDVVAAVGPVAFAMNGNVDSFRTYTGGIYDDDKCTPGTSHGALVYGYATATMPDGTTKDYWLCKNSWSEEWGQAGHFKMVRGKNMCGITNFLTYPLV